jgi:hypothetical protein
MTISGLLSRPRVQYFVVVARERRRRPPQRANFALRQRIAGLIGDGVPARSAAHVATARRQPEKLGAGGIDVGLRHFSGDGAVAQDPPDGRPFQLGGLAGDQYRLAVLVLKQFLDELRGRAAQRRKRRYDMRVSALADEIEYRRIIEPAFGPERSNTCLRCRVIVFGPSLRLVVCVLGDGRQDALNMPPAFRRIEEASAHRLGGVRQQFTKQPQRYIDPKPQPFGERRVAFGVPHQRLEATRGETGA